MKKKILLFDIDATLLLSGHAGTRAVNRAFEQLYGIQGAMNGIRPGGKTDPLIFREIFKKWRPDITPEMEMEKVGDTYLGYLREELPKSPNFRLMPGVRELLHALSQQPDLSLGIATGNMEEGAWLKLRQGGLHPYFRFGGFGSDAENRTVLIRIAIQRAISYLGTTVPSEDIYVIGDTPRDILHGKEAGARTVAVSTGHCTREELSCHDPDHLFPDFRCTGEVLRIFQ